MDTIKDVIAKNPQIEKDLQHLKGWLEKQKHLPGDISDHRLVTFLNSCNYSLETTKKCIDAYYTITFSAPEFFKHRDPLRAELKQSLELVDIAPLTAVSPEGYRYVLFRLVDSDPSNYNPDAATKLILMIIDALVRYDALAPGFIFINDMTGVQFEHMTKGKISSVKKYMQYVQEAMPVKAKAVHMLNVNPIINRIVSFVKPWMNKEHFELLNLHPENDLTAFYKAVPKSVLPKDYGGEDETVTVLKKKCIDLLDSYRDWFLEEEEKCYVDESKREVPLIHSGDFFGHNGSFKKLDLD